MYKQQLVNSLVNTILIDDLIKDRFNKEYKNFEQHYYTIFDRKVFFIAHFGLTRSNEIVLSNHFFNKFLKPIYCIGSLFRVLDKREYLFVTESLELDTQVGVFGNPPVLKVYDEFNVHILLTNEFLSKYEELAGDFSADLSNESVHYKAFKAEINKRVPRGDGDG